MFLENKYTKLYHKIVSQPDTDASLYLETHHIIPRSMGGTDSSSNIVRFTSRKHFICHYLLIKMLEPKTRNWYKMVKAFTMMAATPHKTKRYMNSRLFESMRIAAAYTQSICQSGQGNSQYGTKWINKDYINYKIKATDLESYLQNGYSTGKYTKAKELSIKIKKEKKVKILLTKQEKLSQEKEILKPFLDRFLNGESLRDIAVDYGKSHVSLHLRFKVHFNEQLVNVTQGSLKR